MTDKSCIKCITAESQLNCLFYIATNTIEVTYKYKILSPHDMHAANIAQLVFVNSIFY